MNLKPETLNTEAGLLNAKSETPNPERSSYRQIFKATSLFGGVQVINILIGMVRAKFVAILLGTAGVGIMGLFNAPLQLIISITGLGITFSAVRDISEANESNDQNKIALTVTALRRLSWFAGLLGAFVTILLSPYLSQWTFGSREYTWSFIWLSITLLFQAISKGQIAIIQGTRRLNDLAKSSVFGSLTGLFSAIPLYYFFGIKGIVPSLILSTITALLLSWYFSRKVKVDSVKMSWRKTIYTGETMVKLGLILTITGIIGFLTGYILSAFISRIGGVDQVGLYNAGWSIIGQSTGLVFAAMTTDYFPRLSGINHDNFKIGILVNQQAEMVILILSPILILLLGSMHIIIHILYTPAFLAVINFANWTLLSILWKGLVWPVGFIFPAKGDLKTFGLIEFCSMFFGIVTNILGYYVYGLDGLGISIVFNYIFGLALTLVFAYRKYGFRFDKLTVKVFSINLVLVSVGFFIAYFLNRPVSYYFVSLVLVVSALYSFIELDKRIGLRVFFKNNIGFFSKK